MSSDSSQQQPTQQQPTEAQVIEARFEAVKVATAVAERVLLHSYERQVIVQACVLALQTLKQEHERVNQQGEDDAEYSTDFSPHSEGTDDIDISFEGSEEGSEEDSGEGSEEG